MVVALRVFTSSSFDVSDERRARSESDEDDDASSSSGEPMPPRDNENVYMDAFVVVKSTLIEHSFDKWEPRGNVPEGIYVNAFNPDVSDYERDALDRVVAALEDQRDYSFGEPGWYDVGRESSG